MQPRAARKGQHIHFESCYGVDTLSDYYLALTQCYPLGGHEDIHWIVDSGQDTHGYCERVRV